MFIVADIVSGLGLKNEDAIQFHDWTELRRKFSEIFARKTQEEWCRVFDDVDACVTPVLDMDEAVHYPHNRDKGTFAEIPGADDKSKYIPNAAPRLSNTPAIPENLQPDVGEHTIELLKDIGYSADECERLKKEGIVEVHDPGVEHVKISKL